MALAMVNRFKFQYTISSKIVWHKIKYLSIRIAPNTSDPHKSKVGEIFFSRY